MKKIVSICAVILSVALLVTAFSACGKKGEGTTDATTQAPVADGEYSIDITAANAVVKKGDAVFQELSYPNGIGYEFDLAYAKEHYEFIDMNFDGNLDLYIAVSKVDNVINYYCWLYNASANKFDFSASLSALKNISVDSYEQLVLSKTYYNGIEKVSTYQWVDGVLQLKDVYGDEGVTIPQGVVQSYNDNTIGEVSNSEKATTTKATTQSQATSSTSAQGSNGGASENKTTTAPKTTKPLLTTTTPANGIELVTGDPEGDEWY